MPRSIDAALKLLAVGVLIGCLRLAFDIGRLIYEGAFSPLSAYPAVDFTLVLVSDAVAIVLWRWPVRYIRRANVYGRTLAQLLLALGGVWLVITLVAPGSYFDPYDVIIGIVEVVVGGCAVWQLHVAGSIAYFGSTPGIAG